MAHPINLWKVSRKEPMQKCKYLKKYSRGAAIKFYVNSDSSENKLLIRCRNVGIIKYQKYFHPKFNVGKCKAIF